MEKTNFGFLIPQISEEMNTLIEIDSTGFAAAKAAHLNSAAATRRLAKFRNYADILYAHILDDIHPRKDVLLSELISDVADPEKPMKVKLWDYSVAYPYLGHISQASDMIRFSNLGHHTVVFDNGSPLSVDAIFRKTDLAWRLAFTFGSKFRVTVIQEETKFVSSEYTGYRMGVYLSYYPDGLHPHAEDSLIRAYKDVCGRQLHAGECVYMTSRG